MTSYAHKVDGQWQEIVTSFCVGTGENAVNFPAEWASCATDADRFIYGILPIQEPITPLDPTRVFKGYVIGSDALGMPVRVAQYDDYTLEQAKALMRAQANAYRDERMSAGAPTAGGVADSGDKSLIRANGAASTALVSLVAQQPWTPIEWTMADNSIYVLATPQITMAFASAIGGYIAQCQYAGNRIKAAIEACNNVQAVFAVDTTAGYPNA